MACRRSFASSGRAMVSTARSWSTYVLSRHFRGLRGSFEAPDELSEPSDELSANSRIGLSANTLLAGLSGCLLATCLLKTNVCSVRVSNHVGCCRVLWLAPGAANCGAGADRIRRHRLQRRHDVALSAKHHRQSLRVSG